MSYTCADCTVYACRKENSETMPKNCPMRNKDIMDKALEIYKSPELNKFYITSAEIEAIGYCKWPRLKETIEFAKRMGYKKLGLAFCAGLRNEAKIVAALLRRHGFEVVSVICKNGGIPKEEVGMRDDQKVRPGNYETICNPAGQAMLLNEAGTDFNSALGLCVGHDSFFCKYSDAMVTTLVAKDRALAHNPCGAISTAEGYCKERLEP